MDLDSCMESSSGSDEIRVIILMPRINEEHFLSVRYSLSHLISILSLVGVSSKHIRERISQSNIASHLSSLSSADEYFPLRIFLHLSRSSMTGSSNSSEK